MELGCPSSLVHPSPRARFSPSIYFCWHDQKTKLQKYFQVRTIPWPNTNEILTFYSHLVCKHISKGCSGGGEGPSAPSQLLLAGSSGSTPRALALLQEGAAPGLRGRGEGNSSRVWCLNSPRTTDVAALWRVC